MAPPSLILSLVGPFLSYHELSHVMASCGGILEDHEKKSILNYYFNSTLHLTNADKINIANETIPQPLWMRMYCREVLLGLIISNTFMEPKLKVQIYNGVAKNIPRFLDLYNEYYYLVVSDSIEIYTDIRKIINYLPLKLDKYEFFINAAGEFIINCDGKCVGRNFFGDTIKIIKHYGLDHIIATLKSPLIMESVSMSLYNNKDYSCGRQKSNVGYRRPKMRRRLDVVDL